VTAAAAALRVSRPALSSLLNGNSDTAMPAYCSRWGFCYFDSPRRSAPNS
jgi:hypothetical protein